MKMIILNTPSSKEVMTPIGKASLAEEKKGKRQQKQQNVKPLKKQGFQYPPNISD